MTVKSLNIYRVNFIVIGLMLIFLCVLPVIAQPNSVREHSPFQRKQMTEDRLEGLNEISNQIKNDKSNIELYEKRLDIYKLLMELNYDNKDWFIYVDEYEKDLFRLIKLEQTSEAYYRRGEWLTSRLLYSAPFYPYPPPNKISELYPSNRYVNEATADFLKALQLTSNPQEIQSIYTNLSIIYSTRPQKLVSAPDFPKWKDKIPLKLVQKDFEMSIKYSQLALVAGASLPSATETLKKNLVSTYLANAETAAKLGDQAAALKFTQAAEKYRE